MRSERWYDRQPPQVSSEKPIYDTAKGFVSITFDDGPSPMTEELLATLRETQSKAIFYMLGSQVEALPALAERVAAEGHFIGNHSYSHPFFTKLSVDQQEEEIVKTNEKIKAVTGVTPSYFRPPYGSFTENTLALAQKHNLRVMMWSADPRDYSFNTDAVLIKNVEPLLSSSKILLLHDLKRPTAEALPTIIETIRSRNLRITEVY